MNKIERRNAVVEVLKKRQQMSLKEYFSLTLEAGIVNITARRDLAFFEKEHLISLKTGLIKYIGNYQIEKTRNEQINLNHATKNAIGKYVAGLLNEDDIIYVDPGTTNELFVKNIKTPIKQLVTSGLHIFNQARRNPKIKEIILIGGELKTSTGSFVGEYALKTIEQICSFDKGIFTANSVDENLNFYNNNQLEGEVYQAALKKSHQKFALIDPNKFKIKGDYYKVGDINTFDLFVTSAQMPKKITDQIAPEKLKITQ
ncbi:DeoR family transcriptional regulator, lactose phosphotransferase system repressor [Williamsoniiplasma luminosum]|uniref:DeoR family transcriptional regulator, lactose phosphotransferase system repressor n=1 Tax=Williamsoniiplasma luminosum TaxID=214888 RepID=A0A2K8NVE3_9MOLU|nr:DeoR/GlpR family DNA-binding transcription regulator [Williamsoniiplasma luminosum]ATZ17516.1 DeoR family transcriptional regulator, lactose phosphotransferase system repressor [Williamsoniiplasma luminosum]